MILNLDQEKFLSKYLERDTEGNSKLKDIEIPENDKEKLIEYDDDYVMIYGVHMFEGWEKLRG